MKTIIIGSLLTTICSLSVYADDKEKAPLYKDVDAGVASNLSSVTSDGLSGNKSNFNLVAKSFYLDLKSNIGMPNFKMEYINNAYSTRYGDTSSSSYINDQPNFVDVNLQYGDVVSYYTLNYNYNWGVNVGGGLRQYLGDVEYRGVEGDVYKESLNSTIPLSYVDVFYSLEKDESIGLYKKESQLVNQSISESGLYYKRRISQVDNLSFTASYAISNLSFANDYNSSNYSAIESSGINLQLKLFY